MSELKNIKWQFATQLNEILKHCVELEEIDTYLLVQADHYNKKLYDLLKKEAKEELNDKVRNFVIFLQDFNRGVDNFIQKIGNAQVHEYSTLDILNKYTIEVRKLRFLSGLSGFSGFSGFQEVIDNENNEFQIMEMKVKHIRNFITECNIRALHWQKAKDKFILSEDQIRNLDVIDVKIIGNIFHIKYNI